MSRKKQASWLPLMLGGAFVAAACWYLFKSDAPSTMDRMQHPTANLDQQNSANEVVEVVTITEEPLNQPAEETEASNVASTVSDVGTPVNCCATVTEITTPEELTTLANSSECAVIKFYAPWCGACNHVESYYKDVAGTFNGTVNFYSVNVDIAGLAQQAETVGITKQKIELLPTFVFFKAGAVQEQHVGVLQKEALTKKIKTAFNL